MEVLDFQAPYPGRGWRKQAVTGPNPGHFGL